MPLAAAQKQNGGGAWWCSGLVGDDGSRISSLDLCRTVSPTTHPAKGHVTVMRLADPVCDHPSSYQRTYAPSDICAKFPYNMFLCIAKEGWRPRWNQIFRYRWGEMLPAFVRILKIVGRWSPINQWWNYAKRIVKCSLHTCWVSSETKFNRNCIGSQITLMIACVCKRY